VLDARSIQEARLYLDLHPCTCGHTDGFDPELSLELLDGRQVARYSGVCAGCGRRRQYEFALLPPVTGGAEYGGAEPSRIVDAGEFLWVSDSATDRALSLVDLADERSRSAAHTSFAVAIAALEEVLKFVTAGATGIPAERMRSELGRRMYDANPDRFQLERLNRRREMLVDARARLERSSHG
jgi:hypothetical protein